MTLRRRIAALLNRGDYRRFLVRALPRHGVGCEIGVWKGEFSRVLLRHSKPRRLHLVDPWEFRSDLPTTWHGGASATDQGDMDRIHAEVVRQFSGDHRVQIHRVRADQLDDVLEDGSLDWIYIDGDHRYEAVRADLATALRKVKPGGVIAGDDYGRKAPTASISPVQQAVDEFIAEHDFTDHWTRDHQFLIRR